MLPRAALREAGLESWRREILKEGTFLEAVTLINTGKWAFSEVDPRFACGLITVRKGRRHPRTVRTRGPYHNHEEFLEGAARKPVEIDADQFVGWTRNAAFPALPTERSVDAFRMLMRSPRFSNLGCLLTDGDVPRDIRATTEFHTTKNKHIFSLDGGDSVRAQDSRDADSAKWWPVYKGSSFDLWTPDTGTYHASVEASLITEHLSEKRRRQARDMRSAFHRAPESELSDSSTLPCRRARIAFRDVTRATHPRTVVCALIPPGRVLAHTAPYLYSTLTPSDEAYLLGIMSSRPFDWCARRVVELHLTFRILDHLPVPDPRTAPRLRDRLVELAGRLAAVDKRFEEWAASVGVPVGSLREESRRSAAIAEIDALVGLLYGLSQHHVEEIFETFDRGWDHDRELERTLVHFRRWAGVSRSHH